MKGFFHMANVNSYLRRLNFDYRMDFFSEPDSGSFIPITNANGQGRLYFPFRIVNMWTGKEVGLMCNDYGALDASPIDYANGAAAFLFCLSVGEFLFLSEMTLLNY